MFHNKITEITQNKQMVVLGDFIVNIDNEIEPGS